MATPDDTVTYEASQRGFEAGLVEWQQGTARGATAVQAGADEHARELGISPATSMSGPFSMADETVYRAMYLAWQRRLQGGGAASVRRRGQGTAGAGRGMTTRVLPKARSPPQKRPTCFVPRRPRARYPALGRLARALLRRFKPSSGCRPGKASTS